MDALTQLTLEEAICFGQNVSSTSSLLGHTEYVFDSTMLSESAKRKTAADLDNQREIVRSLIAQVDEKYKGIKTAEQAKVFLQKQMARIEVAARPYL